MQRTIWREHSLPVSDGTLRWYETGDGPELVFLHGGPGLDHRSIRPLAEPLAGTHRCVLYDQRGSGDSRLSRRDAATLHIDRFIDDLEALRLHLGLERLRLIGWSWGATLALLYGAAHPGRVALLAAIAPGPLTPDLIDVYRANLLRPLSAAERARHDELTARGEAALAAGDAAEYARTFRALARLRSRAWFYDPALAECHLEAYLAAAGEPAALATIERLVLGSLGEFGAWGRIGAWRAPTLVLYGYQDFEPITQAYLLKGWIADARLVFLNECGHWPWLEQPDAFYRAFRAFLGTPADESRGA